MIKFIKELIGGAASSVNMGKNIFSIGQLVQKSNAMWPLVFVAAVVGGVSVAALFAGAPVAVVCFVLVILLILVLAAVSIYAYLMVKHPEMLRSEKYWNDINRMSMEAASRGLPVRFYGDCQNDVIDVDSVEVLHDDSPKHITNAVQDENIVVETVEEVSK